MKTATLKQAKKVLELLEDLPLEQLQDLLASGLLSDLSQANVDGINRDDFRKLCDLSPVVFPIWKTIKIGTSLLRTAEDFRKAIKDREMRISDWANDILGKPAFTPASKETELDLVKATVGELGFKNGARRDQIYERAKQLGLEPCPAEVGPQLRLQYQDQPNGEWIFIAMEPIADSDGGLEVFSVRRSDSGLWLNGSLDGDPDYFWDPDYRWVFLRPRK